MKTGAPVRVTATDAPTETPDRAAGAARRASVEEYEGLRFVGGLLLLVILTLGLGLKAVSEVQELPTEQYHVVADPLVLVAAGLALAGIWRAAGSGLARQIGRAAALVALAGLVAWNVGHWPPLTSPDGGWPAAQAAATDRADRRRCPDRACPAVRGEGRRRLRLPAGARSATLVAVDRAGVVVVLCDTFWLQRDAEARTEWKRVWNQLHPKSGDTPRCTLLALRQRFPEACPSPSSFKAPQSLVSRLEPAQIASDLRLHMREDL